MDKLRFTVIINSHLQTIICNWWLHDLWMMHNPVIKRLLYLFIDFWVPFLLLFQWTWGISKFNCLALRFSSSSSTVGSLFFHIYNVSKYTQWFLIIWFIYWWWCPGRYRTVVDEHFRSRNHISLKNILELLLFITLTSLFV